MIILHLIVDHQVIERTLSFYEKVFPGSNEVLIFSDKDNYKHIREHNNCERISKKEAKKKGQKYDFSGISYIVAHYLTLEMIDFIGYAPKKIHVSWELYGYDLYNQFLAPLGYSLQYVNEMSYRRTLSRIADRLHIFSILYFFRYGKTSQFTFVRKRYFKKITNRLNSVSGSKCNAMILEQYAGRSYGFYQTFCYSLKDTLENLYDIDFYDGQNILIGNSCSLTNNHLYVLNYIKDFDLGESKIIMPLSYGGYPRYRDDVIAIYSNMFTNNYKYILNYMPLSEYNRIFLDLKAIVVASWREESFGTIIMGLYLGLKVIMSSKSPVYMSLIEEGFRVFRLENITNEEFVSPLLAEDKQYNRDLLLVKYSEDKFVSELKRQFV